MNGATISVTDLRQNAASVISMLGKTNEPVTVFQRSKPAAVLANFEYFKALEEAVLDLTDAREAEKAKKEPKNQLDKYIEKRWGKDL